MESSKVLLAGMFVGLTVWSGCSKGSSSYEPAAEYPAAPATQAYPGGDAAGAQPAPVSREESADSTAARRSDGPMDEAPREPTNRPGLGTEWGETRQSVISTSPFSRADSSSPLATASLFYNDEEGAQAMASANGFKRFSHGSVDIGGGIATMSLKDGSGRFLSGFEANGKKFLVGEAGERYTIVINSHVPARLELVVSVDGLDVMDGKEASFKKRGYLIDPHGTIEIDGFRQSMDSVAAFRFGAVRNSYASQKHGEAAARNVGVIGIAAFNEAGSNPGSWKRGDTATRLDADPFPGRFATPPR